MRLFYHALFTGFTLFFLLFNLSCTNFFKNPEAAEIPGKQKYVTVSGTFIIPDSTPPIHAYSTPSQRTAFPSMPSDDNSVYSIMAIDTADITKTYRASSINPAEKTFIINIPVTDTTKTFKIRAEKSYKKTDGTAGDFYLYGESSNFSVSPESQIKTINVTLKAHQTTTTGSEEKGGFNLFVEQESNITNILSAKVEFYQGDSKTSVSGQINGNTCSFSLGTLNSSTGKIENGINSGSYQMIFSFLGRVNSSDVTLYSFTDTINIFDNMITDTWTYNGDSKWLVQTIENGESIVKCRITKQMLDSYRLTDIFVDSTRSTSTSASNYTTETGTFINPCTTMAKAIQKLTDNSLDYTIYVKGTATGTASISSDDGVQAHSITICGFTNTTDSIPVDKIDGNQTGTTLTIDTTIPIIIKNILITGGKTTSTGGGILMKNENSKLTLEQGAVIDGNKVTSTSAQGGGIYCQGTLILKSGSTVGSPTANACATHSGYSNYASVGGGIYLKNGTITVNEGAKISYNFAYQGGGIATAETFSSSRILTINGGEILYNGCDPYIFNKTSSWNSYGGGIFVNGAVFNFSSGSIHDNFGCDGGGAIFLQATQNAVMSGGSIYNNSYHTSGYKEGSEILIFDAASFTMTSGSITRTSAIDKGVLLRSNSSTLKLSQDAWISAKAPVYLSTGTSIFIEDSLDPPSQANGITATILPSAYTTSTKVLSEATDSNMIHNYGNLFAVQANGSDLWSIDILLSPGYLVAATIVDGKQYVNYQADTGTEVLNLFSSINSILTSNEDTENLCISIDQDIDLSSDNSWTVIGQESRASYFDDKPDYSFKGVFDGKGHTITFDENDAVFCALVCHTNEGIIQNVKLVSTHIISINRDKVWEEDCTIPNIHDTFAGFCYINKGIIRNCWNTVSCDGTTITPTGGICSQNFGTVENCINTGNITAKWSKGAWGGTYMPVGGICGVTVNGGKIINCVNYGTVKANKKIDDSRNINGMAGAITGRSETATNIIQNNYWRYNCVLSHINTGSQSTSYDTLNWMVCKPKEHPSSTIRTGNLTGNGYFNANNSGSLTAANADDAGSDQTLEYGTNLLPALNSYVTNNNPDGVLCTWKAGTTYAAIPSIFTE